MLAVPRIRRKVRVTYGVLNVCYHLLSVGSFICGVCLGWTLRGEVTSVLGGIVRIKGSCCEEQTHTHTHTHTQNMFSAGRKASPMAMTCASPGGGTEGTRARVVFGLVRLAVKGN